jgi:cytochrome c peroxidase
MVAKVKMCGLRAAWLAGFSVFAAALAGCTPPSETLPALSKAELGRKLFFDTRLSEPEGQSCASCHDPQTGFADPHRELPVSLGAIRSRVASRNAPTVGYAAFSPPLHFDPTQRPGTMEGMYVGGQFWDGRVSTLEDQAKQPLVNPVEMNVPDSDAVVARVRSAGYTQEFEALFGRGALDDPNAAHQRIVEAIAEFERSSEVSPFTSKYDLYLEGKATLTEAEARGLALFSGNAKCKNCHSMDAGPTGQPLFTNFGYQNIGVPKNPDNPFYTLDPALNPAGANFVDLGLGGFLNDPKQNGKHKIPSLRNVAVTAPYMHNGVFKTIREVVVFDNTRDVGQWPPPEVAENVHRHMPPMAGTFGRLGLADQEVDDIVAFLQTLTDGYQ